MSAEITRPIGDDFLGLWAADDYGSHITGLTVAEAESLHAELGIRLEHRRAIAELGERLDELEAQRAALLEAARSWASDLADSPPLDEPIPANPVTRLHAFLGELAEISRDIGDLR